MNQFIPVYVPVGVPTFDMDCARQQFERSAELLRKIDENFIVPDQILLSAEEVKKYLDGLSPDAVIFQNVTFANGAYIAEVKRGYDGPLMLWALREPASDGGRLRLNSLTGTYSAARSARDLGASGIELTIGAPEEEQTGEQMERFVRAARIRKDLRTLRIAAVGHTPQGFGFGRALDADLQRVFGSELISLEARELIKAAETCSEEERRKAEEKSEQSIAGLETIPEKNRTDHARLYHAYRRFAEENGIGAMASRCWPDFFTEYGTPVCAVLSMLNDDGIAASCETDVYGALSMWIGMRASGAPAFFGDPVCFDEKDNTLTFWHCGAGACSLAREDTGARAGVHPNRKIGPVMDFGCEAFPEATIFRVGREADGTFRFFLAEGEILDRPKQFAGTSVVVRLDSPSREVVEQSIRDGFEPHFTVLRGRCAETLRMLAELLHVPVCRY